MRGPYHIETSPLIFRANHWNGFYMIETSAMKDLSKVPICFHELQVFPKYFAWKYGFTTGVPINIE